MSCSSKSASTATMAILCSWMASYLISSSLNMSYLLSLAASEWLNEERKVAISIAMVGSEKIASFMMGEVKPTESGVSKGGNFEATRDNAWRMERSSGREDYRQTDTGWTSCGGRVLFHNESSQDLFRGLEDGLEDLKDVPVYNLYFP